jgi:hypothetical protein
MNIKLVKTLSAKMFEGIATKEEGVTLLQEMFWHLPKHIDRHVAVFLSCVERGSNTKDAFDQTIAFFLKDTSTYVNTNIRATRN